MLVRLSRSSRTTQSSEQSLSNSTGSFSFMILLTRFSSRASDMRHAHCVELMGFSPDCELWTVTRITKCCDPALYANVPTFLFQAAICSVMADLKKWPKRPAGIVDYIEKPREELLTIQRSQTPHPRQDEPHPLTVWRILDLGPTRRTPAASNRRSRGRQFDQISHHRTNNVRSSVLGNVMIPTFSVLEVSKMPDADWRPLRQTDRPFRLL